VLGSLGMALAAQDVDGPWTGNDFSDTTNKITVVNGIAYGQDYDM